MSKTVLNRVLKRSKLHWYNLNALFAITLYIFRKKIQQIGFCQLKNSSAVVVVLVNLGKEASLQLLLPTYALSLSAVQIYSNNLPSFNSNFWSCETNVYFPFTFHKLCRTMRKKKWFCRIKKLCGTFASLDYVQSQKDS